MPDALSQPLSIFVYGTLQRGQLREPLWPRRPLSVELATLRGQLYDLGLYPALVDGDQHVHGELWALGASDVAATLEALDRVEGYHPPDGPHLYERRMAACTMLNGQQRAAYAYFYADAAALAHLTPVAPSDDGLCRWP